MNMIRAAVILFSVSYGIAAQSPYPNLPLAFERQGEGPGSRYLARGRGFGISIENGRATLGIRPQSGRPGSVVSLEFAGRAPRLAIPGPELPGKVNYIRGADPHRWQFGLPTYSRVTWRDTYPGIDVAWYGDQRQLEFDLLLHPGADPSQIRMKFRGASRISVAPDGLLAVDNFRLPPPVIYQESGGARKTIQGRYRLLPNRDVTFRLDPYDRSQPLVIDPTIVYAAQLGGGIDDTYGFGIAVDPDGNAYVAGTTYASDFPTANAAYPLWQGGADGFVTKINSSGTAMVYSTFVGGSGTDAFYSIAVDSSRSAYVVGYSNSPDFPTVNAYQSSSTDKHDTAVVLKLNPSGGLAWSTFLGDNSYGYGIAVDPNGNAYAAGYVEGSGTLPLTAGVSNSTHANEDAFVAKFSSTGSLLYATYVGGAGTDLGTSVAADAAGNAYLIGSTDSASFSRAPAGGAQPVLRGSQSAFIAKLNPTGTALLYFTFLGGSSYEDGSAIAVDASGNAYVAGDTLSSDFPATTGLPGGLNGVQNGFVAKLNNTGSAFLYARVLGGNRVDTIAGLAIDTAGNAYVGGNTNSNTFPVASAVQPAPPGNGTSLFATSNSGASWSPLDSHIPGAVTGFSPDPGAAGVLVAATQGGVYRTTNSGASWNLVSQVSSLSLSRSPANSATLYGISCGASLQSTDGGLTWKNAGISGSCPNAILADPLTAATAYAYDALSTVYGGPYKTTDGGATWNLSNTGLPSPANIYSMVAASDGALYVDLLNQGVYKSADHGATWVSVGPGNVPAAIHGLAAAPGNPLVLYKSTASTSILKTTDGGTRWVTAGILPSAAGALAVSPANPLTVYAATQNPPGVYVSTDGGATWNPSGAGLGPAVPTQFIFSPAGNGTAYALAPVTTSGFAAKINPTGAGLVWSTYLGGFSDSVANDIAASPAGDAFVTGYNEGPLRVTSSALPGSASAYNSLVVRLTDSTAACTYAISPSAQVVYSTLQTLAYSVLAPSGCAWTFTSSNPSWAAVVAPGSGAGTGQAYVVASPNLTGAVRTATLTAGGQPASLTQAPSSCSYGLNSPGTSIGGSGGPLAVNVTATAGCPWSVVNSYPFAITVVSGGAGTGNGTVNLTVGTSGTSGTATFNLLIAGLPYAITQSGPPQSLSVVAPNPAAGSGTSASFTFAFTDSRGWQDLDVVDILVNNFLDGRHACYLAYSVTSSALYLVDDAGDAGGPFAGSLAPGSTARIQNSQCSVALTSATGGVNTFTLTLNISFTASFGGNKVLYAAARDHELNNTNWQAMAVWQAPFTSPVTITVGSPNPTRGSAPSGTAQTFVIPLTDTKGAADIGIVDVLINNFLDGRQACYVAYAAASNSLLLVDDLGDAGGPFAGAMVLNGQGSIQNSQCLISGAGSSVESSGNTLTLTLNVTFKSAFAGNRIFYIAGRDQAGANNTDWQAVGTWSVQ